MIAKYKPRKFKYVDWITIDYSRQISLDERFVIDMDGDYCILTDKFNVKYSKKFAYIVAAKAEAQNIFNLDKKIWTPKMLIAA
jgi:hypothetical protein